MDLGFIERALLGGIGIALIAGPLGALMVWRRMANFGDALGHSMLLGVCFAILLNLNLYVGLFCITLLLAIGLVMLSWQKKIANDTLLSVLAQTTLALGLIFASTQQGLRIDLLEYLYGDILSIQMNDIIWVYATTFIIAVLLWFIWRPLLSITVHEELAQVEGTPVKTLNWLLIVAMAFVFAVAMKLVGVLLITALLIIPASSARTLSKTPEQMAFFASCLAVISVILGILMSQNFDVPTGPSIVVSSFVIFIVSILLGRKNA